MILYYIRHGDPIYEPDSLTELGKRQAEAIAKRISLHGVDRIFASTSNRAILTAKPTSEILKKDITLLDFCNESHAWDELSLTDENGRRDWIFSHNLTKKLFVSPEIRRMGDSWYEHPFFKEYNFKKGIDRINTETDKFLKSLGYEHDRENKIYKPIAHNNETIALFAHQGFGLAFLSSLLDIPYPEFTVHFDMTHTGMTVIEFNKTDDVVIPKILTYSNDSHIYKEGLPTKYNNWLYL